MVTELLQTLCADSLHSIGLFSSVTCNNAVELNETIFDLFLV